MTLDELEPEWDSEDSTRYHDGLEQGEADRLGGLPYDDHRTGCKCAWPTWAEGYREGYEAGTDDA